MKYVDTDVLLYWALDHAEHGDAATRILRHVELNEKACTSALTFYLFDGAMQELGTDGYELGLFLEEVAKLRNLRIEALNEKTYARAAEVQRDLKVDLDVAMGIVVATDKKADAIYSHNPAYDRGPIPRRFAP